MKYPKIHSLYKRDPNTHKFLDEYSKPEFASCSHRPWDVQEKIDGMNIRIYIQDNKIIDIEGRTDEAFIPPKLLKWLQRDELREAIEALEMNTIILFGEGFGSGIQSGGIYRKDQAMILFDTYGSQRWGTREEVTSIAEALGMETPYRIGRMTMQEAIDYVKSKPNGWYGSGSYPIEGVICRSEPLVRYNKHSADPIMFKLKCKDFE